MDVSEGDLDQFGRAVWSDLAGKRATAVNQAKFGLSRILPVLNRLTTKDCRILEVGAGRMLLSAYLASKGFQVTALEPLTADFSWFDSLQADVFAYCARQGISFERVETMAEDYVAPARYDVIFSIHVLEHVRDPLQVLDNMYRSLKQPGLMLALCPNYDVLFEPHLGILLTGRSKSVNARIYAGRVAAQRELWNRLVFIRYSELRRHLDSKGIPYAFNRDVLRDMFLQLGKDELFYARMPTMVRWAYRALSFCGATNLLSWVPLRMQTPMELLVTK
jgi:2-polyprenyl-3-methyl-5-hydroxy-6-metoxy-1,4-benzoquinol methylase